VKDPQETWKALLAQFPAYQAELILLGRCGQQLASVLREEVDPLELIFPKGSLITEQLYQDAPSGRIYNLLVQKAIATALERLPKEQTVRILEIGAGTGGMTSYVLPVLPTNRTNYIYTDVSKVFTASAEQKFHNYPFVEYRILDIEADAIAQGFEAHSFDLILASNVLHATRDLHHTLEHVKQLLTADGLLVLLELTSPPSWIDLVFGLLKGWWLFTDLDLRPSRPLLQARQWQELLEEVGFSEVAGICDTQEADKSLQTVILARGPHVQQEAQPVTAFLPQPEQSSSWLIFADNSGVGQQLAELLKKREENPILVSPGGDFKRLDADHFQVNPEHPEDIQQLLEVVDAEKLACRAIVHLWSEWHLVKARTYAVRTRLRPSWVITKRLKVLPSFFK
jgi:SAM-dependent methyltransferase